MQFQSSLINSMIIYSFNWLVYLVRYLNLFIFLDYFPTHTYTFSVYVYLVLKLRVAPPKMFYSWSILSWVGIGFNGGETNCETVHIFSNWWIVMK